MPMTTPQCRKGSTMHLSGSKVSVSTGSEPGSDIALRSEYPAMIEIRDTSGDLQRQQEMVGKIFTALKSAGRWRAVYIDDMQKVLDSYDPAQ
jgi:hypothetical protein